MHLDVSVRACPVCGASQNKVFMRKNGLSLVQCATCTMVFTSPLPAEFSDASFYRTQGSTFYSSQDKLAGDYSPVRYAREIKTLRRYVPRGRVLDVGCSTGGFLYYLRETFPNDYEITGTDVAAGALDIAESKRVPVLRANFLGSPIDAQGYDAITFWAVLEHLSEPGAFLRKARDLLVPNGRCFILVPNIESLAVKILGSKYRYILPQHLNYFSITTLRRLVEACGLKAIHCTTTHFNPLVILQDIRSKSGLVPDQKRAELLVKTNRLKSSRLLLPVKWFYGRVERTLGRAGLADNVLLVAVPDERRS